MSPPKGTWTWGFHSRSASFKAQAAPLIKGHRAKLSSTASVVSAVDERAEGNTNPNLPPLHEEEYDPADVQRASTVHLAPVNTSKLQRRPSYSDMSQATSATTQEKDSLPTPVQSKSTGSDVPESVSMNNIKRFLMQEIDTSRAAAPLTAYCFMTGFMCVVIIPSYASSR